MPVAAIIHPVLSQKPSMPACLPAELMHHENPSLGYQSLNAFCISISQILYTQALNYFPIAPTVIAIVVDGELMPKERKV